MSSEKIYRIKNIDTAQLESQSPLGQWFADLVNKQIEELSLLDISRMLRQEVLLDIAMPLTLERLLKNPFEGEMYEGQLLELYIRCLRKYPIAGERKTYLYLHGIASRNIDLYDWLDVHSRQEYKKILDELEVLIEAMEK
ncbi:MAG: contact-dependent growth inhibition system immunity protein [Clostridium sp.]|nr:contact-dependent growth inhibition system immunity protein [Clostridium sp.]